ncbi:hypothetical protein ACBJ59_12920 [Nonomuraea sp. MTCD27]|uniref:hypothetical protein n=1 Tax=Nonomuraea sp. MTCD27 TaxID=1676747 RepID=UPI0035C181A6
MEGIVYAVLLTCKATHDSIGWNPTYALPGVRLPQFGAALRDLDTSTEEWPLELKVLRLLIGPAEDGIATALERCNRWPDYREISKDQPGPPDSHAAALRLIETVPPELANHRERTVIQVGEQVAQMLIQDGHDCFEQWFFFDDRWAGAHPDLAASLIWFAYHWDPLCSRPHLYLTPCSDNRIRYVAVVGEDGQAYVREAEPRDEPGVWDLRRWSYENRPPGDVTTGEVLGTVEIKLQEPSPDSGKFTEFEITRTRHGQAVAAMLARHVLRDLQRAGVARITGWLPDDSRYPHGRRFLRMLGEIHKPDDGRSVLVIR